VTRNLPLHRTTMASIRLVLNDPTAAEVSQRCMNDTRELLLENAEDRLAAELVMLVAEGLYMRAALGEEDIGLLNRIDDIAVRLEQH
jgi:hypothetical protein